MTVPDTTTSTDAPSPTISFTPTPRGPESTEEAKVPSVRPPGRVELELDPESGLRFMPWTVGGVPVRCARAMPTGFALEFAASMEGEGGGTLLKSIDLIIDGLVWDEDIPKLRARLADKRDPIDQADFAVIVKGLWDLYSPDELGKETPA